MGRRHNDINVLALAGRRLEGDKAGASSRPSLRPSSRVVATSGASTRSRY